MTDTRDGKGRGIIFNRAELPLGGAQFTISLLPGHSFRRFPINIEPPDGFLGFVNNDCRQSAAIWKEGRWCDIKGRPIKWEPTHWTALESPSDGR